MVNVHDEIYYIILIYIISKKCGFNQVNKAKAEPNFEIYLLIFTEETITKCPLPQLNRPFV